MRKLVEKNEKKKKKKKVTYRATLRELKKLFSEYFVFPGTDLRHMLLSKSSSTLALLGQEHVTQIYSRKEKLPPKWLFSLKNQFFA